MTTVFDVNPNKLISAAAIKLEGMGIEKPAFVGNVKSGPHRERLPQQKNFWFLRCAAVLRQAYTRGTVGVSRMRTHFGGAKARGVRPNKQSRSGGSTIRKALQALEKAGLLAKAKTGGRMISSKGRQFMDSVAKEVSS
jgi:small subunit ribosomal protein S19e